MQAESRSSTTLLHLKPAYHVPGIACAPGCANDGLKYSVSPVVERGTWRTLHLVELRDSRRTSCAHVRSHAQTKIADIERRIRSLRQVGRALTKLARECESHGGDDCPLVKYLEREF